MQMTTDARAWLDETVRRVLARHPLGDLERAGMTYEIMSHLHGAGEAHAKRAGRTEVTREDLEAALRESGGEEGIAAAFVQPLARPIERVLFWRRLGAFAVDSVFLLLLVGLVHGTMTVIIRMYQRTSGAPQTHEELWGLMPWGYHDATMSLAAQAAIALASGLLVLGYYTWLEGHDGRSLGKRALGLRVMRVDGKPMTYGRAFLRNLVKLSPPILIIDTIVMLLFLQKDKQRLSDKIADTIVVRA